MNLDLKPTPMEHFTQQMAQSPVPSVTSWPIPLDFNQLLHQAVPEQASFVPQPFIPDPSLFPSSPVPAAPLNASRRASRQRRSSSSSSKAARAPYGADSGVGDGFRATPTEVFRHAAFRASTRRRVIEEPILCIKCKAKLGLLYLRGTVAAFESRYAVHVTCRACEEGGDGKIAASNGILMAPIQPTPTTRKRTHESPTLDCEVCKRQIGFGGLEMMPAPFSPPTSSTSTPTPIPITTGPPPPAPAIATEPVCATCNAKYLFCSECGGGGRTRTGKYRPRELFEPNRRTCSLPHVRIGDAEVKYRTVEVPREMSEEVVQGCQDVFFDCLISLYAVPSVIEERFGEEGYAGVKREVEGVWKRTVVDVVFGEGSGVEGGRDGKKDVRRKYLTIAWIEKRHRNKAKVKKEHEEAVPWLTRLALEGTVAPTTKVGNDGRVGDLGIGLGVGVASGDGSEPVAGSSSGSGASATQPTTSSPLAPTSTNTLTTSTRCYVAFSISEWDPPNQTLLMIQMAPRSVFLPTMDSYGELLRRAMERVQSDARKDGLPLLEHIWCWTRGEREHVRLDAVPERMGFVRKEEYLKKGEGVIDPRIFERREWGVLREEGVKVWVKNVGDFLRKGKS
ncbi:hypothetical protein HDV00_010870 [Rhizophlyctis rosea]|nr:hypothetical protein HDV00_010870 [Rhizophlyctis rosea]